MVNSSASMVVCVISKLWGELNMGNARVSSMALIATLLIAGCATSGEEPSDSSLASLSSPAGQRTTTEPTIDLPSVEVSATLSAAVDIFASVEGTRPKTNPDFGPDKIWSSSGYYDTAALEDCKGLGVEAVLLQLGSGVGLSQPGGSYPVNCAWYAGPTGISARVDGPVDFEATKFWAWFTMGNPDSTEAGGGPDYVGSLDVGADSALFVTHSSDKRNFWAMVRTETATYIVSIHVEQAVDAEVPDEFYTVAITEILTLMIANRPTV